MASNRAGFKRIFEASDVTDELGRIYILVLFLSGIIWGFLAVNNVDTPDIFKISLVYSILLILALIGIGFDRSSNNLGLDSVLWQVKSLQRQIIFAIIFSILWIAFFINNGLFLAIPLSISSPTFAVGELTKFLLVTVLGPLAENIFFFGVINFTLKLFIRQILEEENLVKSAVLATLIFFSQSLFADVPYSNFIVTGAALVILVAAITKSKAQYELFSIISSSLIVGGVMFPVYHSKAYQLNEKNFIAATIFGVIMCLVAAYIGLLPVDIVHSINNMFALGG